MLNYPSSGDIIAVQGVRKKEDCRAYRVFEYYIETLIADLEGEGLTRDEAEDRVFYARREDESNPHQPLRVFACSTCKAKCAMQVRLTLVLPSLPCASPAMLLPLLYLAADTEREARGSTSVYLLSCTERTGRYSRDCWVVRSRRSLHVNRS